MSKNAVKQGVQKSEPKRKTSKPLSGLKEGLDKLPDKPLDLLKGLGNQDGGVMDYFKSLLNVEKEVERELDVNLGSLAKGKALVRAKAGLDNGKPILELAGDAELDVTSINLFGEGYAPKVKVSKGDGGLNYEFGVKHGEDFYEGADGIMTLIQEKGVELGLEALGEYKSYVGDCRIVNGQLFLEINDVQFDLGGVFATVGSFSMKGTDFSFTATSSIFIKGLAEGELYLSKTDKGLVGETDLIAQIANVSGGLKLRYDNGIFTGSGNVHLNSEKFKGDLSIVYDTKAKTDAAVNNQFGIESVPQVKEGKDTGELGVAAFGEVELSLTDWLTTKAKVGVNSEGFVTVQGDLEFPEQLTLMEQETNEKDLFDKTLKFGYGVPLVAQIYLFARLGMFMRYGYGPMILKGVKAHGTYSNNPAINQHFLLSGAISIGAFAELGLEVDAGAGLTVVGHDVNAGLNLSAVAGLKAYADGEASFEYKEKDTKGAKVGEARLKGAFEAAANLSLLFGGGFFVELDSPWWSPAPDDRWDFPFEGTVMPLGEDGFGIGGEVDWLIGSEKGPELQIDPVSFNPDKFLTEMADDPSKVGGKGKGGKEESKGSWGSKATKREGKGEHQPKGTASEAKKMTPREQFYAGLDAIGELAKDKATQKKTKRQVRKKVNALKKAYGLDKVTMKGGPSGEQALVVTKGKLDNKEAPIALTTISEEAYQKEVKHLQKVVRVKTAKAKQPDGGLHKEDLKEIADSLKGHSETIEKVKVTEKDGQLMVFDAEAKDSLLGVFAKSEIAVEEKTLPEIKPNEDRMEPIQPKVIRQVEDGDDTLEKDVESPEEGVKEKEQAFKQYKGWVDASALNVRAEASLEGGKVGRLTRSQEVTVIAKEGEWLGLASGGWVHGDYISTKAVSKQAPKPTTEKSTTKTGVDFSKIGKQEQIEVKESLDELMEKERLSPPEIAKARVYIEGLSNTEQKAKLYRALAGKVSYKSQRNNKATANAEDIKRNSWMKKYNISSAGDLMCNLTSMAMALESLGVSNPDPRHQFEDVLEYYRSSKYPNNHRGEPATWRKIAQDFNVGMKHLPLSTNKRSVLEGALVPVVESGGAAIISAFSVASGKGHIVRLQEVTAAGFIVDDPFGQVKDLSIREKGSSGYRSAKEDNRNSKRTEDGVGEDNLWTWENIEGTVIKYAVIFTK